MRTCITCGTSFEQGGSVALSDDPCDDCLSRAAKAGPDRLLAHLCAERKENAAEALDVAANGVLAIAQSDAIPRSGRAHLARQAADLLGSAEAIASEDEQW